MDHHHHLYRTVTLWDSHVILAVIIQLPTPHSNLLVKEIQRQLTPDTRASIVNCKKLHEFARYSCSKSHANIHKKYLVNYPLLIGLELAHHACICIENTRWMGSHLHPDLQLGMSISWETIQFHKSHFLLNEMKIYFENFSSTI